MKPIILNLCIIVGILLLAGFALAHGGTASAMVDGYKLEFTPSQVITGDTIPVEAAVENGAEESVPGLTVTFKVVNVDAGINETMPTSEREPGHYVASIYFPKTGIYEIQVSFDGNAGPVASTFDVIVTPPGSGCNPSQAAGCSGQQTGIPGIENDVAAAAIVLIILSFGFFGFMKKNWKIAGISAFIIIAAAILGYSLYVTILSGAASSGIVTCVSDGACYYTAHIHTYVPITICGQDYRLPIEKGSLQGPHTHEEKNIIHWHDRLKYDKANKKIIDESPFTLKAFFDVMEIPFNSSQFGDTSNQFQCPDGSIATLKMVVNGKNNTEFENYRWHDHDVVLIAMDGRSVQEIEQDLQKNPIPFPSLGRE